MNYLVFSLVFFFLFLIIYSLFFQFKENLTPMNPDVSGNTFSPISINELEKEVEDLSGNIGNLQSQVNTILESQNAYLSKNTPDEPNISLQSVS
jgi:predicted PurR-regulated permease PerM